MYKSIITLILAATSIQLCLSEFSSDEISPVANTALREGEITQTKRYKLAEFAYEHLKTTVWPEDIYTNFTEYMEDLKDWSEKDEILKNSEIYNELQKLIDSSIGLLKDLKNDQQDCDKQAALKNNHKRIQQLFQIGENENLRNEWLEKYVGFILKMREILKETYSEFYVDINEQVIKFIAALDNQEKKQQYEIVEWHKEFKNETNFFKKQVMIIEFMSIFYDERLILERHCKVEYGIGL